MSSPAILRAVRACQVVLTTALGAAVLGVVIPFTAIALRLIPGGLANLIYVAAGGVIGAIGGAIGGWATLRGSSAWMPGPWVALSAPLVVMVIAALIASAYFDAFAHV